MSNILVKPWIVDPCPDAYGNWTIRLDDGSENGDTDSNPVATVYSENVADSIVLSHNASLPRKK